MKIKLTVMLTFAIFITGCGGGGGGSSSPPVVVVPPVVVEPVVLFPPSENFIASCEAPRTGIDPFTGLAFPDTQGSTLTENQFLRSWSNELYLWYDEIIDQEPELFDDTLSYFDTLKTLATTPSGNLRDNFHFALDTEEANQFSQSGVSTGYGVQFDIYFLDVDSEPTLIILVLFVEPGSPADEAGMARGDLVTFVDGVDVLEGEDLEGEDLEIIEAGIFPASDGEAHSFTIYTTDKVFSSFAMTSADLEASSVLLTEIIPTATGDVGYIVFNSQVATAEQQLVEAVTLLQNANVTDLVLDMRYNGGGFLDIASQAAFMVAGPAATEGKIFELLTFNDKHPTVNPVTLETIEPSPFIDETIGFSLFPGSPLPTLDLPRVFILATAWTCSASEAVINGLRGINVEVILIGSTTCGKPYGFYSQDNCGTTYYSIQFEAQNDIGFGAYSDGFSPQNLPEVEGVPVTGCLVADDPFVQLGDPQERMLAAALLYRNTGICPSLPSASGFDGRLSILTNSGDFNNPLKTSFQKQAFMRQNSFTDLRR